MMSGTVVADTSVDPVRWLVVPQSEGSVDSVSFVVDPARCCAIKIYYAPNRGVLELASVRRYLGELPLTTLHGSHLAARICDDMCRATQARWCRVTVHHRDSEGLLLEVATSVAAGSAPNGVAELLRAAAAENDDPLRAADARGTFAAVHYGDVGAEGRGESRQGGRL
jgi:hypothetical protein